ncbi:MAG: hypothetical protein Q8907_12535 [Bacteroidota bacterium]|nr:hypothetical protein [Bacteroidota bacterium]
MKKLIVMLILISFSLYNLYSQQDTIVKRNNERIACKIKEISSDEIKYQTPENDILKGIDKTEVTKVILSSGVVMNFQNPMYNQENYADQKKNCLKFKLLSPLFQYSDFTYERSLKPGASMELSLGIIGLGKHYGDKLGGSSFRLGYKFIKSPDFYLKGLRYAHILKGMYFRPEAAVSVYEKNSTDIFSTAMLFVVGNQWVFNNILAVDLYFGLGYGYSTHKPYEYWQYGYSIIARDFPAAVTSGFRIGVLF